MKGTIYALARTRHPFVPQAQGKTPFTTLLVELSGGGGARLLGQLAGPDQGIEIGTPVEGEIEFSDLEEPALRWRLASSAASEVVA